MQLNINIEKMHGRRRELGRAGEAMYLAQGA